MNINDFLDRYLNILKWNKSRADCFAQMILGVILSSNVQQHKCSLGFVGKANQDSVCRRIRNFLGNFSFDLLDVTSALICMCNIAGPFDLALDRTNWKFGKKDINLLVLTVIVSPTFAIPLIWVALPKQGNSNSCERIDLIGKFINRYGVSKIASLTADREFIGKNWIDFLMKNKILFFIRIKGNRLVEWGDSKWRLDKFFNHLKVKQTRYIEKEIDGYNLYFAGTRSVDGELVIVMCSRNLRNSILKKYKQRWTIELMFKHFKSNGFNMEDIHLRDPQRIEKLLAVIASALTISYLVGKMEETIRPTAFKKTVKSPIYCTFRRGYDKLRKLLIQSQTTAFEILCNLLNIILEVTKLTSEGKIVR